MSNPYYAYLDAFDEVTIIVPKDSYHPNTVYSLQGNDEIIDLEVKEVISIGNEEKLVASFDAYINLSVTYFVVSDNGEKAELYDGKIVRTPLFDSIYYYRKNDLGVSYTRESTKFRIWSPIAKRIVIELVSPSGEKSERNLFYKNQGIWRLEELGDFEGYKYRYRIYLNGKIKTCLDPYAIASAANNEYDYVIDPLKVYKMKETPKRPEDPLSSVIYETSFEDFTSDYQNDPYRSTYLKFVESGHKTVNGYPIGFDYLKSLGVTHVQIMPFFAFGGVDELNHQSKYNWGYNPVQYNVPSGLYASKPDDPYSRINELKKTIDEIHKAGLFVVMDVVFNHVYKPDEFPFEILCPGYFYMYNREGIRTAYSGCENDIDSAKKMVRKFIIDSVLYWAKEYRIDGFRMDIMGLIDFETVNDLALELRDIDPGILLYGEGWKMIQSNAADSLAHMFNKNVFHSVGFFNDRFRDSIKAYAAKDNSQIAITIETLMGSVGSRFLFKYASQSINYTECHDGMTLYDEFRKEHQLTDEEAKKRVKLATSMTILSSGMVFLHSGQEFYDSKNYESNSYISGDLVNEIKWENAEKEKNDIEFLKSLIALRKKYLEFRLNTQTEIQSHIEIKTTELSSLVVSYHLQSEIVVVYKNDEQEEAFTGLKDYQILLTDLNSLKTEEGYTFTGIGLSVLLKE